MIKRHASKFLLDVQATIRKNSMNDNPELEKNIDSLVAMVSDLYERVNRLERVLIAEETIEAIMPEVDEYSPDGLLQAATGYVKGIGRCSVSMLQKEFKISYKRAFSLLDLLETEGVIAPYRGEAERVVNQ